MSPRESAKPIYFGGRIGKAPRWMPYDEWVQTEEAFLHFVATVWANEHDVPTDQPALGRFNLQSLLPEYEAFLASGRRLPERGLSVEELWLMNQLGLHFHFTVVLNSAQPEQPMPRVTRLRKATAAQMWAELELWYANPALDRPMQDRPAGIGPVGLCVYDGVRVAHVVNAWTIWNNELHFQDPWPDRSLLCAEKNAAQVKARVSDLVQHCWRIKPEEFQRVIFAMLLYPYRKPIYLTEEEQQAADAEERMMAMLRRLNKGDKRPIESIFPGARIVGELEAAVGTGVMWRVKVALRNGADVNEKGTMGIPLHIAAANGNFEIVRLLVEQGADCRARDSAGQTAADVAAKNHHTGIAKYLRSLERKT